jgi:hypothetical protein
MFRNLFLVLAPGTTPADRVEHHDTLSTTLIVPVPDTATAVTVAEEARYDLIELYGGLGAATATAILAAVPNTPVGYPGGTDTSSAATAVLFEDPSANPTEDRWTFGTTTVVAIPSVADAPEVAAALVAAGAERVELCGGMGPIPATAVQAKVTVPVTTVLFGFESLPAAADYRARYEAAVTRTAAR